MASPPSVAVLGGALTGPVREDTRSIPEMVLDAVAATLEDAGRGWGDVEATVTASADLFDGLTASNVAVTEVVGGVLAPETRIAADGLAAAAHAWYQLRAGAYRCVLVVAHGKASMSPTDGLTQWALDPIYLQPLGVDFPTLSGLQASLLAGVDTTGATRRWAAIAEERRRAAGGGTADRITARDVLESPVLAAPLTEGMSAPFGDAACAVLLGVEPDAEAVVSGVGCDLAPHHPDIGLLTSWQGLRRACGRAYAAACIEDPSDAFDLAEPSCRFPHEEQLFVDASGIDAATPLSPTGGLFGGTAPIVAGLTRLLAAFAAVRGRRGRRALAHGTWGPCGQGQAAAVVEGR
jgi:acetyl-CoA acetyltransferase